MNYELAKQLRDSGFHSGKENEDYYEEFRDWIEPSLSELIAACGDRFEMSVRRNPDCWGAVGGMHRDERGKTPEEAVARLWLALNQTHDENNSR